MTEQVRFVSFINQGADRAGATYRYVARQPGWITRAVAFTVLLVLAVPIVMLVAFAMLAGLLVFAVLFVAHVIMTGFRNMFRRGEGRENVRIIRRE